MKNYKRKLRIPPLLLIILILIATVCIASSTVYAWILYNIKLADTRFQTGTLASSLWVEYWDKEEAGWAEMTTAGDTVSFYPDLGEMTDLTALPGDCRAYFKIKVNVSRSVQYNYAVYADDINIDVYSGSEKIPGTIDYYSEAIPQSCFMYSYSTQSDGLSPAELSFSDTIHINSKSQSLSGGGFVSGNDHLYVKLEPKTNPDGDISEELQNIIKCISVDYMPYRILFKMTITGEARTIA